MKLEARTIQVLKNFSTINPRIVIKEGNVLVTKSPSKSMLGRAVVPNTFEGQFAIYELSRFLGALSLFEDADLTIDEKHVIINNGAGKSIRYSCAEPTLIDARKVGEIKMPSIDASFVLPDNVLKETVKALGVLGLPNIVFIGDGTHVSICAMNVSEITNDVFSVVIGTTDKVFKAVYDATDIIKILPNSYKIDISSAKISHFAAEDIDYWIGLKTESEF